MVNVLIVPRIISVPKRVLLLDTPLTFNGGVIPTPECFQEINIIRKYIISGTVIPEDFYRSSKRGDALLVRFGYMHLCLLGQSSNIRLYLKQYDDHVMFVEVNTHLPMELSPPGASFRLDKIRKLERETFGSIGVISRHTDDDEDDQ